MKIKVRSKMERYLDEILKDIKESMSVSNSKESDEDDIK